MLKLFLDFGQDVNAIGGKGRSILILFVVYKHTEAVKYLLGYKKIDLKNKVTGDWDYDGVQSYKGENALDIARREKMYEIVAMLEKVTCV